ncbi:glycosyltransferase family 4 protein [Comamonas sp. NoAH]|uniref:glycosyltransferase family 4 protein n=1 Tax=Comamonas halotolerans TaxID=3041496 RepID=UPI0024E0F5F6|nr:glycosyltransferase family 1 protein [Comamonas sp. NoAH]
MRIGLDYRPAMVAPKSGIARQVFALEQALRAEEGAELLLFGEAPLDAPERQHVQCPPWGGALQGVQRPQRRWAFERRFLPRALRQHDIILYIATANMGLPIAHKPAGVRHVLLLHDLFQLTERNAHRLWLQAMAYRGIDTLSIAWSLWRADQVWCPSLFTCREVARRFPWAVQRLRLLPNQVESFVLEEAGISPSDVPQRYWLLVGTREPRKNIVLFLESWHKARLSSERVPELVLVGHPSDVPAELASLPGVHWRQGLSDAQLHQLYAHALCLWQPSFAEGFGLPVIEACHAGTPVIVASGSALDEVAPGQAPRFPPHDPAALLQCMLRYAVQDYPLSAGQLMQWAQRFNAEAYRERLRHLLLEMRA